MGVLAAVCRPRCSNAAWDGGRWLVCSGIAYVRAREWRLACMGMLDPCSGSDDIPCAPLQLSAQVRVRLGRCRFPVLHTYREGIRLSGTSRFRLVLRLSGLRCGVDLEAPVVSQVPRTPARARVVGPRRGRSISRMRNTQWVRGPRPLFAPKQAFYASCERRPFPFWPSPRGAGHAGDGVGEECYLVDPASSHMLVSKIKPCMCKYELIQTVKLRMAH